MPVQGQPNNAREGYCRLGIGQKLAQSQKNNFGALL